MPVEAKPIFRPDVIRLPILGFSLPESVLQRRPKLEKWAEIIASGSVDAHKEAGDPRRLPQRRLLRAAGLHPGGRQPQALHVLAREARPGQRQVRRRRARRVRPRRRSGTSRPSRAKGRRTRSTGRSPAGRSRRSTRRSTTPSTSAATGSWSRTSARPASITRGRTSRPTSGSTPRPWPPTSGSSRSSSSCSTPSRMVPLHGPCHLDALLQDSEKVGRELTKEVYADYAFIRESTLSRLRRANPEVEPRLILGCAQKLLDRILFIAFCEDRGLLPAETIKRAYAHRDPYNPRPLWENFRGMFRAINVGNDGAGHPQVQRRPVRRRPGPRRPEGPRRGLRPVPRPGRIRLPAGVGDPGGGGRQRQAGWSTSRSSATSSSSRSTTWRSSRPSWTSRSRSRPSPRPSRAKEKVSRRKREGAFYTPAYITRYIVEQALGGVLRDRFETLRRDHAEKAKGTARERPGRPAGLRPRRAQGPAAGGAAGVLAGLAGRAGLDPDPRPGLRQRGVPDRGVRPAPRRVPADQRPGAGAAGISPSSSTWTARSSRRTSTAWT